MSTHAQMMHAAFTSTTTLGAGRPDILLDEVADVATDVFRVGYAGDGPAAESPVLQSGQNDENRPSATIPKIWLAHTPVRKRAKAVKRMDQGSTLQRVRTINKIAGSVMFQRRKARAVEETSLFVFRTPAKLTKLTSPPPLKRKGMVEDEDEDVSEEVKEAFIVWMRQRMEAGAKKAGY